MNRWKMKAAALLCALSVMPAAMPQGADAAEWINLSSWSYAEVSGFVSEGLLPESLGGISDYTRPIKRWEFCELIYSVLDKTGMFKDDRYKLSFADCDDHQNVNKLYSAYIVNGVESENGTFFYPENDITREDAAVVIENMLTRMGASLLYDISDNIYDELEKRIYDAEKVSEYAQEAVTALLANSLMSDTGNGYFEPGSKLTVEQAVVIVYRSYKQIPKLVKSDSDGIETNVEQTVKSFECGLTETYDGSSYYIKENGSELMRFESDVYSRIFCDEYSGKRLAFAVNFNDKTDVYDLGTKELLYTIPYITYRTDAENGWVYVYSSRFMPAYSGLYSMDGKELIAPEYSEKELNTISKNDFDLPQEEYRAPDGWIYYSNWNDNGSLNKVDTNGENGKCLVQGLDCYDTEYFKGTLFFKARENDALYCIDKDGEDFTKISDNAELFWPRVYSFRSDVSGDIDIRTDVNGNKVLTGFTCYYYEKKEESFGGKLFYGEPVECSREYALENGISLLEDEEAYILYEFSADNGEADAKKVADFPAYNITSDLENDKMYFMNADELVRSGGSPIYIYDGKDITAVSDGVKAVEFGFWYDPKTSEPDMSRLCYITQDEIEAGTYHVLDPDTGETTVENFTKYVYEPKKIQIYGDISTDDLEVWRDLDTLTLYIEYNGSQKDLGQSTPVFREGNWIYYWNTTNISYGWSSSMPIRVIGNQMHEVRAYNYVTDEDVLAADDYDLFWQSADNLCIYATPMLQYRVFENSKTVSVYPCKGISKYGEARCFDKFIDVVWQPDYLYKIDTDGNITAVTDCDTEYWLYVPEGEDKPEMQQWG